MMKWFLIGGGLLLAFFVIMAIAQMSGAGGIERITTLSGVYSVCKPDGYPAVCFADKSGGGFSCVPYSGECK